MESISVVFGEALQAGAQLVVSDVGGTGALARADAALGALGSALEGR